MEDVGSPEASGVFSWPRTEVLKAAIVPCPYNANASVTRQCQYKENGKIAWGTFDSKSCKHRNRRSQNIFALSQV